MELRRPKKHLAESILLLSVSLTTQLLGSTPLAAATGAAPAVSSTPAASPGRDVGGSRSGGTIPLSAFYLLAHPDPAVRASSEDLVFHNWHMSSMPMVLEVARFAGRTKALLVRVEEATGQRFAGNLDRALRYMWKQEYEFHPGYAEFKKQLYQQLDPRFASYFEGVAQGARIRLDEIRWVGSGETGFHRWITRR